MTKLLHFNDVYHIKKSGRFLQSLKDSDLVCFSGDIFSPSIESTIYKGQHMIPFLSKLNNLIFMYGNHDFDFGPERLLELSKQLNCDFVLSNVFSSHPLGLAQPYVVKHINSQSILFLGLAGSDFLLNCPLLNAQLMDPVTRAKEIIASVKAKQKIDIIVALTHMRMPDDLLLQRECPEIDWILGGHDHHMHLSQDQPWIVKSGSDFDSFSLIDLSTQKVEQFHVDTEEEHPDLVGYLKELDESLQSKFEQPVFVSLEPLDGRSLVVRAQETGLGNLLADAVRRYFLCDIAIVNSGSIRSNKIDQGLISMKMVLEILPFQNYFQVRSVRGSELIKEFENAVSDARTDGRFLHYSGVSMKVDNERPSGSRVVWSAVSSERWYTVAMTDFIASGCDGFNFQKHSTRTDAESVSELDILLFSLPLLGTIENNLPTVSPKIEGRILQS
ncbi:2,3-cyclic-nucleotide 2-phosphodiesterase [Gorgonomyces haynaldii]|nr:2,3-cyclic-nucleotide 2-phosphodiesterase [Gorgonomyces haynaldii]